MPSLANTLRRWGGRGRDIDIPFRGMSDLVRFRTGQIAIIGAAAGAGKTTFCANWAWRSNQPVLYLGQEDPFSTIQTLVALATGQMRDEVTPEEAAHWADRLGDKRQELEFVTGAQTISQIEARIVALTEWLGEPPHLIMVDSLFDVRVEGVNYMDTGYYAHVLPEIKRLSLQYDVGFIIQHHLKRDGGDRALGIAPLKMTDLMFGGEKEAAHVWGVYHRPDGREMYLQILKQRNGRADPSGGLQVAFDWQPEHGVLASK